MVIARQHFQRGFTLIELLVGIVVMAMALLVAVPYTSGWFNNSAVVESSAVLQQAHTRTKAMAVANPQAILNGAAAAYVCSLSGAVYVQPINATTCGTGYAWVGTLKPGVAVKVGTSDWACTGFDTSGLAVALSLGSTVCSTSNVLTISKGDTSDSRTLY